MVEPCLGGADSLLRTEWDAFITSVMGKPRSHVTNQLSPRETESLISITQRKQTVVNHRRIPFCFEAGRRRSRHAGSSFHREEKEPLE